MKNSENSSPKNNINYGVSIISWNAPEFREIHRGPIWKLVAGIFALGLIGWAIWQNTYAFAVVVLLIAGIYFLTHNHKPKQIEIDLRTNGILAASRFYSYSQMQAFWILFLPDEEIKSLNFTMKSGMVREVSLELEDQDPTEIRNFLSAHVYELENRTENSLEKIIRILKL